MTGFHSVNPYTGEVLGHYPFISDQEISNKIAEGQKVYYTYWKKLSVNKRSKLIKPISGYLRENKFVLGELISREMGKPVRESVSEIEKVAWMIDFHCDNASKCLKDKKLKPDILHHIFPLSPLEVF
ncbi:MAG: aldehyde dehydrogenase family protein [Saprospiraceae bacterium]|nr:aldehyde dehydrogenase family protein [Saprospiraceae bacterium]